ncbi:hypothetical protein [Acetobacter nitrogenifigens]|uniref:Uncharacterized protein n=1 Tax=Acetobacter nitrogenifigens DSM 23921 = NBRC 105050 TaxID=1120919 RepID=A0A511XBK6_9PROT|nr:hypothetical protein [Acetobacter nitrogenifigens]GEN60344.1 hypothetical protein ANI02nite_22280 [Acetobacter nitrogenifigens DSM 23921 = NBRC 105050]
MKTIVLTLLTLSALAVAGLDARAQLTSWRPWDETRAPVMERTLPAERPALTPHPAALRPATKAIGVSFSPYASVTATPSRLLQVHR